MDYLEITCTFAENRNATETPEIVIAWLAELGFESFEESEDEVKAYIPAANFDEDAFFEFTEHFYELIALFDIRHIEHENWNHAWESNFPMTEIADRIVVYAPFHEAVPDREYRICIMPQMSFGTGHHETTSLMLELMLDLDMNGKRTLDMGCGTGILAIFAAIKKAHPVTAVDIDEWAFRNAAENCERNSISEIEILQGDSSLLTGRSYDIVLANITRNILLADMSTYAECLSTDGLLLLSGFYSTDFTDITAEARQHRLLLTKNIQKKNWMAAVYRKII